MTALTCVRPRLQTLVSAVQPHALMTALRQISYGPSFSFAHENQPRVKVKPYPRQLTPFQQLMKPSGNKFLFNADSFTFVSMAYPRSRDGTDARQARPSWLPWPPSPATHTKRHLINAPRPTPVRKHTADADDEDVRWEAAPWQPPRSRVPVRHILVLCSKKKIHKLAVVRNRVRTRLVAAFRQALKDHSVPIPAGMCIVHAKPTAYDAPMATLVDLMKTSLVRSASNLSKAGPEVKTSTRLPPQSAPSRPQRRTKRPLTFGGFIG